jgi:hypothetical protein
MREFPPFRLDTANQCLWRGEGVAEERIVLAPKTLQCCGLSSSTPDDWWHLHRDAGRDDNPVRWLSNRKIP